MDEFDTENRTTLPPFTRNIIYKMQVDRFVGRENDTDARLRTLRQLKLTCYACSMCPLGLRDATEHGMSRDPHVFSSMHPAVYMVIGREPVYADLKDSYPHSLANRFRKHTGNLNKFYFTNLVKCCNTKGDEVDSKACLNILKLEIAIVKPKLIIACCEAMPHLDDDIPVAVVTTDEQIKLICELI